MIIKDENSKVIVRLVVTRITKGLAKAPAMETPGLKGFPPGDNRKVILKRLD